MAIVLALTTYLYPSELLNAPCSSVLFRINADHVGFLLKTSCNTHRYKAIHTISISASKCNLSASKCAHVRFLPPPRRTRSFDACTRCQAPMPYARYLPHLPPLSTNPLSLAWTHPPASPPPPFLHIVGYLTTLTMQNYDPKDCASYCDSTPTCGGINNLY